MDLIAISENTVKMILILGVPSLLVSMIIGLLISTFSAVTQINDASLTFVPKIIFTSIFIVISLPWIGDKIYTYTIDLWTSIILFGQ